MLLYRFISGIIWLQKVEIACNDGKQRGIYWVGIVATQRLRENCQEDSRGWGQELDYGPRPYPFGFSGAVQRRILLFSACLPGFV